MTTTAPETGPRELPLSSRRRPGRACGRHPGWPVPTRGARPVSRAARAPRRERPLPAKAAQPLSLGSRGLRVRVPVLTCSCASLVRVARSLVFTEKWGTS